jgi:hypothetical protein
MSGIGVGTGLRLPARRLDGRTLDLDFTRDQYRPGGFGGAITFTRAGSATFHDGAGAMQTAATDVPRIDHARGTGAVRGLLVEGARTNLFLNSGTPATQSVTVTAVLHALSFYGTGTITLSGAHSDTLTGVAAPGRAVLIFTPSAGTLTLTVAGDVQMAQLEAGNCATSYIATAGSAVTRVGEVVSVPHGAWYNPAEGTFLCEWQDINQQNGNTRIIALNGVATAISLSGSLVLPGLNNAGRAQAWNNVLVLEANTGMDVSKGTQRAAMGYSATGRSIVCRGVLATNAGLLIGNSDVQTGIWIGGQSNNGLQVNGCIRRVTYWPFRVSDAALTALAPAP